LRCSEKWDEKKNRGRKPTCITPHVTAPFLRILTVPALTGNFWERPLRYAETNSSRPLLR
jgi:hypothetical protein